MKKLRNDRRGIALVMVLLAITVLTAVVVQFSYDAHVDYSLAANQADETRAYYLARSGINFYKLILTADQKITGNKQLGDFLTSQGMGPVEIWRLMPMIDTGMLRAVSSEDVPDETKEELKARFGGIAFDTLGQSDGFLDFEGDIHAEITSEECKINLNEIADGRLDNPLDSNIGRALYAMSIDEKYDFIFEGENLLEERKLARDEVIANLIDYIDPNTQQLVGGGFEDVLYNGYDERYNAKNAKFETIAEVAMVRGIDDDFMEAFASKFTVYGGGKVNINCAEMGTIAALILAYSDAAIEIKSAEELAKKVIEYRDLVPFSKVGDFVTYLTDVLGIPLRKLTPTAPHPIIYDKVDIASKIFTVRSTGFAGEARVTITAVIDNIPPANVRYLYWRVD